MDFISHGLLQINKYFKISMPQCPEVNLSMATNEDFATIYTKLPNSRVNTLTENIERPDVRKSKSVSFKCLFDLHFLLDALIVSVGNSGGDFFQTSLFDYKLMEDNLHIYGAGDFFDAHVDHATSTDSYGGQHIGTFVILLNVNYEGGNFYFSRSNELKTLILNNGINSCIQSDFNNVFKFILFSLDVRHGVEKIVSGHRVVLKFKLYRCAKEFKFTPINLAETTTVRRQNFSLGTEFKTFGNFVPSNRRLF